MAPGTGPKRASSWHTAKMDSKPLEAVMLEIFHREADILIASAIIQSGIDVPTANTIIVNRADTLAWPSCYQLRGRWDEAVNRPTLTLVPDEGTRIGGRTKRLTAIQQFYRMGSGSDCRSRFGNSGRATARQTTMGHIAAIGLDSSATNGGTGRPAPGEARWEEEPILELRLSVSAYIPEDYVVDSHQRLSFYKRLSSQGNFKGPALCTSLKTGMIALIRSSSGCSNSCKSASWRNSSVCLRGRADACAVVITFDPKKGKCRRPPCKPHGRHSGCDSVTPVV